MKKPLAALAAALILAAPLAAGAQDVPSYAVTDQQDQSQDQQIRGRVENFDGGYNLQVRDDQGYTDTVQLHDGTIINPTGLTIAPGMVVSILGFNSGSFFSANEVDTPYNVEGGSPYYDGHPWGYYGPSIDLSFFFGNVGWWHGNDFGGGFRYDRGVRVYNDVHIRNNYRDNAYRSNGYRSEVGYGRNNSARNYTGGNRQATYRTQPVGRTNVGSFGATRSASAGGYNGGGQRASAGSPAYRSAGNFRGASAGGNSHGASSGGFARGGSGSHGGGGGGSHGGGGGGGSHDGGGGGHHH